MNASAPVALFTASQIASASGLSKRAVLLALANVTPSDFSAGQDGRAGQWPLAVLPDRLRIRLETAAQRHFCRDAEALLRHPVTVWQPPVTLAEVSEETRTRAVKLQRALARPLARMDDLSVTPGELVAMGLEDYRREFGFAVSARHWRRLLARTCERDGGLENWSRLEIYLDEVVRRSPPTLQALANAAQWTELSEVLSSFANPLKPTSDELSLFWTLVFEQYERGLEEKKKRDVKGSLLAFLFTAAPVLSDTASALKRQFNRKHSRWVADGRKPSAVADRRSTNSGRFRAPVMSAEDADKLVGHATLFHGGRVSQAWKALSEKRELNHDLLQYYQRRVASPDIPRAVRAAVLPEIERLNDIHHGPRQTKLNGPHIDRDWSGVHAGDWYQSDDCTLPVYFYVPDGQGWFALMRGQFLPMIDLRSKRVLEFALLPKPNYHSPAIKTLMTRTCDEHGLPSRGWYFENGIWRNSKLIVGENSNHTWNDTERGMRDLGLEFRHAKLPRAKPIEHVLGLLQDRMEGERGYIGCDERHEKFERVQKQILLVKGGKEHPTEFFYSFEEWQLRLREICEQYNAAPQRGKMTEGRSPDDAFEEFQNPNDPPIRFDAACRYLLAHHQRKLSVKRTGINFKIGKQTYTYVNERTGQLVGEDVIAWFNPELPDVLCVTDLNRENPFAVERLQS
ncbi:MAG TPA: hypothetical protein VK846_02200, partial [Candidatus Limnocylindria bacterium]|nr:hypothetical protein [Candidatus Limnocylindria bacterium]